MDRTLRIRELNTEILVKTGPFFEIGPVFLYVINKIRPFCVFFLEFVVILCNNGLWITVPYCALFGLFDTWMVSDMP